MIQNQSLPTNGGQIKVGPVESADRRKRPLFAVSRSWKTAARMTDRPQFNGPNPLQVVFRLLQIRIKRLNCLPQPEGRSILQHPGHLCQTRGSLHSPYRRGSRLQFPRRQHPFLSQNWPNRSLTPTTKAISICSG